MHRLNRTNKVGQRYYIVEQQNEGAQTIIRRANSADQIIVHHSIERVNQAWYNWTNRGWFIQDAFNFLTADEREFITGITGAEWTKIFPPDEEKETK